MIDLIKNLIKKIYRKDKPPKMTWWTYPEYGGLLYVVPPVPATKHFPKFIKNMPEYNSGKLGGNGPTAKHCPGFIDLYKHAYVLPMWCDANLTLRDGKFSFETPFMHEKMWDMDYHGNNQFLDFLPKTKEDWKFVWKPRCPWLLRTPKGYSVLQLPMTYDFNNDFEVLSGVIDTDKHHEINQQIVQKKDGTINIKRGTPLCMYLPFKRESFNFEVVLETQELWSVRIKDFWNLWTKHTGAYKERQKEDLKETL